LWNIAAAILLPLSTGKKNTTACVLNLTDQEPKLKAALFLYLNRHGYNGLCRYNASGEFNTPFGRYKKPYFPEKEMLHFAGRPKRHLCLPGFP